MDAATSTAAQLGVGIPSEEHVVFGLLHRAESERADGTAVVICPPFGWEDMCSYRSRRAWAQQLAAAGHTALRIDLPATGESSGSPREDGILAAWTAAVGDAAAWLREVAAAERIVVAGIGLGGLVAARAAAEGAAIDELVLWAVQTRGKRLLRELRAFASLNADVDPDDLPERTDLTLPPPQPDGSLAVGGFLLGASTLADLETLDFADDAFNGTHVRRALLLGRDGAEPESRLRELLEAGGVEVETAAGDGYTTMMDHPQQALPPLATFEAVEAWLGAGDAEPADATQPAVEPSFSVQADGATIRETPIAFPQPFGDIYGVVSDCEAATDTGLTAVFLNAGALRRIGPGRMWVEVSREWAARGIRSVRIDLEGLGDADGDGTPYADTAELYVERLNEQTMAVVDQLAERGLGSRFVCIGLCSGAFWSFHAALAHPRVEAAFLLNPRALYFDNRLDEVRDARQIKLATSGQGLRKVAKGGVSPARAAKILRAAASAPLHARADAALHRSRKEKIDAALAQLEAGDKRLLFVFGDNEPLYDEMVADGQMEVVERAANMRLERIPGRDHSFRPISSQRHVRAILDDAIAAELTLR